jgi:hypothetical protein
MENKRILSPSKRYKKAESEDLEIRTGLERSEKLMREGDKNIILDIAELYRKERNQSTNYKIYGKLNMVFRNLYSGTSPYGPLLNNLYLETDTYDPTDYSGFMSYDEFGFLRRDYEREVSNPTGSTIGDFSPNIYVTGGTGHQSLTQLEAPFMNWNLYLTYVYDKDPDHIMRYSLSGNTVFNFTASMGVPFRVTDKGEYYELTSPSQHNMIQGEYVILSGQTISSGTELSRCFGISSVGNEFHDSEKYTINLTKSDFGPSQTLSTGDVVFGKRCIDKSNISETTSEYYVRKHKTITTTDDYILDNAGFESPIFEIERKLQFESADGTDDKYVEQNRPESVLYHFKNTIDLSKYTNNLGYTPTEVFLTTIFRNGNGYFNYPPRMGWRFNFHDTWMDDQFNFDFSGGDTNLPSSTFTQSGITFTKGEELPLDTILDGDFVEFNNVDFKETVISNAFHKISSNVNVFDHGQTDSLTYIDASPNNPSGYFYQTHHQIKLRELSPYIETSNTDDILNLPENTVYDDFIKLWKWRDLYDHGYIDPDGYGTNFPFTNNQHYVKNDINFYFRNEQSFNNKAYGIYNLRNRRKRDDLC